MYPNRSAPDFFRIVLLLAALASFALLSGCASEAKVAAAPKPAVVERPKDAATHDLAVYSGSIHARYESALGFRVAGKIKQRRVDLGAQVKKGEVLAELDPQDAELALSSARAQAAWSKADLALAQAELERHKSMLDKRLISQSLYDAKVNAHEAAKARAEQASAQLAVSANQSRYNELRADADGVITAVSGEPGQVVAAGQAVVTLAHDGEREVLISVPEGRIKEFAPAAPVAIELWSATGQRYEGKVREVAAEADAITRTYSVRVSVSGSDPSVKLGMTARVYQLAESTGGLSVPLSALAAKDGKPGVWRVDPKTQQVKLVPVEVLAYGERTAALRGGITRYDWVVVAGVHKLTEGQTVKAVDADLKTVTL